MFEIIKGTKIDFAGKRKYAYLISGVLVAIGIFAFVQVFMNVFHRVMNPQGFNIGLNLGKTAGAGVEDHLHVHVVPRWDGDTNFMPVIGEIKVISEHIQSTYDKLLDVYQTIKSSEESP